jgi:RNA polymerase sigma-70 factor (ECF subfamily)
LNEDNGRTSLPRTGAAGATPSIGGTTSGASVDPAKNNFVETRLLERVTGVLPVALPASSEIPLPDGDTAPPAGESWLAGFHEGRRDAMEACYREYFGPVDRAVGRILRGADRETVVHDVFARLMSDGQLRLTFKGGHLAAWLCTLARNLAVDFARHRRFERPDGLDPAGGSPHEPDAIERRVEVRLLIERFRREYLPRRWSAVFEARFVQQMDQTAAAQHVGVSRTTLAYQEYRIRRLLRRFASRGDHR